MPNFMAEKSTTSPPYAEVQEAAFGVGLEQFGEFINQNPALVENIKKANCYSLHLALVDDYRNTNPQRGYYPASGLNGAKVRRFMPYHETPYWERKEGQPSERQKVLNSDEERYMAEVYFRAAGAQPFRPSQEIALVFSADARTVRRYSESWKGEPANPELVRLEGIYVGQNRQTQHTPLAEVLERGTDDPIAVHTDLVESMIGLLERPVNKCETAITDLRRLAAETCMDASELLKLETAIVDFATYVKPEPLTRTECFAETGRCSGSSRQFRDFCAEWIGANIGVLSYNTATNGESSYMHVMNILNNGITIDWTARQFMKGIDDAYPLIGQTEFYGPVKKEEKNGDTIRVTRVEF
jgi:hypothetical protein